MSKVLLWSPAIWVKGAYAKNMAGLALRLKKAGHEAKNFALTGLAFSKVPYPILECQECGYKVFGEFEGQCPRCGGECQRYVIEVLPNNSGDHGQDWLNKWNLLEGPFDTVIFHYDAWVLGGFRPPEGMRLLWYSPVDHSPVPPPLVNTLKGGGTVVAMSRFAEEELKKAGIVSIYVPHAFDPSIYHPGDRIEARKRLELPEDCFLIACIARNTGPRKNLGNMLRAFRDFLKIMPRARENAFLFLNTNVTAGKDNPRGYNLPEIWNGLGIAQRIKYTHPFFYEGIGFSEGETADAYRAADWTILCMPGRQKVLTPKGLREIKSIKAGDLVFTHKSVARRVGKVFVRPYAGQIITIKVVGGYKLCVTPEHPVLAMDGYSLTQGATYATTKDRFVWKKAKEVKVGDYVFVVRPNPAGNDGSNTITWGAPPRKTLQIPKNTQRTCLRRSIDHILPRSVTVDGDLMRLMGYYLAEGSASLKNGVIFSLNRTEKALADDVAQIVKSKFGVEAFQSTKGSKLFVRVYSKRLAILFTQLMGRGSHRKHLPSWVMDIKDERGKLLPELVRGAFSGDGSFSARNDTFDYTTVSRRLAEDMVILLMRIGFYPHLKRYKRNGRLEYTIRVTGKQGIKFADLLKWDNLHLKPRKGQRVRKMYGGFLVPVTEVRVQSAKKYSGKPVMKVYNLSVEHDESFATPIATHNCSLGEGFGLPLIESLACGTPVIYSDFSSCPEVVGPGGLAVEAAERIPFELSSSFQWLPSTSQITRRLCQAYEDWEAGGKLRDELGEKGRRHVFQNYTWERVMPLWLKLLEGEKEAEEIRLPATAPRAEGEVDIILITHNHLELLTRCVESLYENTTLPFHLVIVDDHSIDGTREYLEDLRALRGNITYIRPKRKAKGGAEIMNIGLRHCRDPQIGIVGMKFLYPDNKIQHAGGTFIKAGLPFHLGIGEPRETHSEIREVSWVSGPCVLIRRRCLEPGWDEVYDSFGGHEDIDLCLRARKQGWKVVYCGKSEVYHLEGATVMSMPNFWRMHLRSREIFLSRWGGTRWVR